jgi:hypothetical protein
VIILVSPATKVRAESAGSDENQVKAAFLYNFLKFVDWPDDKVVDNNETIVIGIIGEDPFGEALNLIKGKPVGDKKVVVKRLEGFEELRKTGEKDKDELNRKIETLRKCHVLFICSSEKENVEDIINLVKNHNVLTVGDIKGFLKANGIINFLIEDKKVRFEINAVAAEKADIEIRSKLLRLAKRVVDKNDIGRGIINPETQPRLICKI